MASVLNSMLNFIPETEPGRLVGTRTPDLYRVTAGISSTHNNFQGCWGLPST